MMRIKRMSDFYMIEVINCTKLPSDFKWDGINNDKPGIFIHHIIIKDNGLKMKNYKC